MMRVMPDLPEVEVARRRLEPASRYGDRPRSRQRQGTRPQEPSNLAAAIKTVLREAIACKERPYRADRGM
jgi:hypothetical protein